jgi:NAD(P)-dependent dehydrogenase (short-subunit alcohol dehydrogenase family)
MVIAENKKRVVMITGGSRGIGLAVAKAYAKQGDRLLISGRNDKTSLENALASLNEITSEVSGALVDVRDRRAVQSWVNQTAEIFGRIDVAISNAGVIHPSPFLEISEEQWDEVVDTHLKGTFLFLQAVARIMIARKIRGSLITVTAPSAVRGSSGVLDYASAKGGIIALTKNMAKELAQYGIRVNCVLPVAATQMTDTLIQYAKVDRETWDKRYPLLGRMPTAEDVASAFTFLGSEASRCMTGQVLYVDAGTTS